MKFEEAKYLFEKGTKHLVKKEFKEAIFNLEKSLEILPKRSSTIKNLVFAYIAIGNFNKAQKFCEILLLNNDNESEILNMLNQIFKKNDKIIEFSKFISTIIEKKKIDIIYEIQKNLAVPKIFENEKDIAHYRNNTENKVNKYNSQTFNKTYSVDSQALDPPIFTLSYDQYDNKKLFTEIVNLYRKLYPKLNYIKDFKKKETNKIKIGFISNFLTNNHTIGKLYKGLIKNLDREKFEISIFNGNQSKKKDLINNKYILPGNFDESSKLISKQDLDIIFYPDIGMSSQMYFLTFQKLARYQITSWGHPETTGNTSIDYFLSSNLMETQDAQNNYSEKLILSNFLPMYFYKPLLKKKLDKDSLNYENIYSCPQTLVKIHPEFDEIIEGILKKDKKAKIYFLKDKDKILYKKILKRFNKKIKIGLDRIIFMEQLSEEEYINHCGKSSVLLDPLYFGAGLSFYESMFYGTPTVSRPTKYLKSRIALGAYKQMKIKNPPIVSSNEEYIEKAVEIANNSKLILQMKENFSNSADKYLYENKDFIKDIEKIFFDIII